MRPERNGNNVALVPSGSLECPLFVAMNGLFVAAEFALVGVRKTRVEEMVHHGQKGAKGVELAVANLDRSIAATQLGITLASLALGWAGEPALARLFEPMVDFLPATWMGNCRSFPGLGDRLSSHHLHARRLRRVDSQDLGTPKARRHGALGGSAIECVRRRGMAIDSCHERHGKRGPRILWLWTGRRQGNGSLDRGAIAADRGHGRGRHPR